MIPATKIIIGWSESNFIATGKTFTGESLWSDAATYLNRSPKPDLGYYKTDFTVHYEDGETYGGRYDIGADEPTLGEHIRQFIHSVVDEGYWDQSEATLTGYRTFRERYEIGA